MIVISTPESHVKTAITRVRANNSRTRMQVCEVGDEHDAHKSKAWNLWWARRALPWNVQQQNLSSTRSRSRRLRSDLGSVYHVIWARTREIGWRPEEMSGPTTVSGATTAAQTIREKIPSPCVTEGSACGVRGRWKEWLQVEEVSGFIRSD